MTLVRWCWMPVVSEVGGLRAVINVASSYAAEIMDGASVRWVPMTLKMARAYAHASDAVLPTRKIVDLIASQAEVRVEPITMPVNDQMASVKTISEHSEKVLDVLRRDYEKQWRINLMVGTHKDLVESPARKDGRLAIYGWHRLNRLPIQPLNTTAHNDRYYDYSHGVRLVKDCVLVGDDALSFRDVCASKELSILVSDEGPFRIEDYG